MMFDSSIYIKRRQVLENALPGKLLLFLGNSLSPRNFKDNTYAFRQDSTFLYYLGINKEELALIRDPQSGSWILFGDNLTVEQQVWSQQKQTLEESAAAAGIQQVQPYKALTAFLKTSLKKGQKLHFLPPYRAENQQKLAELTGSPFSGIPKLASIELIKAVAGQRSVKSEEEISEIEKAVSISVDMHLLAMQMARPGQFEREIASAIGLVAQNAGGELAYPPIVTINGQILHNHDYGNRLREGQLLLNDSGAETALGYAGDLTRTFPVSKTFSTLQKEMYTIVFDALMAARAKLSPSTPYLSVHLEACKEIVKGLSALGLMRGDTEEAVAAGAHALFFPCGTGHMMGLDVHDMEDLGEQYIGYTAEAPKDTETFGLKSLRLGKALLPGYVVTVEPGIYFIPSLIEQWAADKKHQAFINYAELERFKNFGGIRIEDNFLITQNGHRLLGKPLATTAEEIEEIRQTAY